MQTDVGDNRTMTEQTSVSEHLRDTGREIDVVADRIRAGELDTEFTPSTAKAQKFDDQYVEILTDMSNSIYQLALLLEVHEDE